MNLLFIVSKIYIPAFLKKKELMNLFRMTASAFGRTVPSMERKSFDECLTEFAIFTKSQVDDLIIQGGDPKAVQDRLYQGAFEFGEKYRKRFHVSTINDIIAVSRLLYSILGIDFQGTEQGTITISKCFFSHTYSSSTCRVISSLDAGMIAGLSGGGEMTFSKRITEGSEFCQAQFIFKEQLQ
jgi:hypothetical protein